MSNNISRIQEYSISGDVFDGDYVPVRTEIVKDTTLNATATYTYSLEGIIPSDGYIYEVKVSMHGNTPAKKGNTVDVIIATVDGVGYYAGRITARSADAVSTSGNVTLKIEPDNQNITVYNQGSNKVNYFCLHIDGYKRLGTNDN